jgi:membrane protein implicated in regulation of membrane protease activity
VSAFLASLGPWAWILLGLVLIGLELAAPGVFFLWLGLAALLTGLLDAAFGLSWQAALLAFAVLSVGSVMLGRLVTGRQGDLDANPSGLNRRGHEMIGRVFTLEAPILDGSGRVRVDDSSWRVTGPDAPAGASVRVVRVDGATLVVERV